MLDVGLVGPAALAARRPVQVLHPGRGRLQRPGGVVPGLRPRPVDDRHADHRRRIPREQVLHEHEIARRLGHLHPVHGHRAHVQPRPRVGGDAGQRLGHRRVVGVVREAQVGAPRVDVHPDAERRHRHRDALGVPPGPARPPGGVPRGVAGLGGLPHGHVERVVLNGVVRPAAVLPGQAEGVVLVQSRAGHDVPAAEVDAPVPFVGGSRGDQGPREPDHRVDVAVRSGLVVGRAHVQRRHVALELELLEGGVVVVAQPRPPGGVVEDVVDVGDVAAHERLHAQHAQHAAEGVHPDERGRVAEVGHVVGRDAAGVHAGLVEQAHRPPVQGERGGPGGGPPPRHRFGRHAPHRPVCAAPAPHPVRTDPVPGAGRVRGGRARPAVTTPAAADP